MAYLDYEPKQSDRPTWARQFQVIGLFFAGYLAAVIGVTEITNRFFELPRDPLAARIVECLLLSGIATAPFCVTISVLASLGRWAHRPAVLRAVWYGAAAAVAVLAWALATFLWSGHHWARVATWALLIVGPIACAVLLTRARERGPA